MGVLTFQNRRDFLKLTLGAAASVYLQDLGARNSLLVKKGFSKLTVLYTNDTHSRIEPFPANDVQYPNEGGFARRAALIAEIKKQDEHILILDAGDIFQGTPYFNYYHGEVEYKLMSLMGYDATTFGNHDFDLGCGNIIKQMPHASFDFLNCNYDFKDSPLAAAKKIAPYKIYKKGHLKIGVLGVGIDLENLVDKKHIDGVRYGDPVSAANKIASVLKNDERCDYVICLSHLGYSYEGKKVSDIVLASHTKNIDLIIGGHTHTFLEQPKTVRNTEDKDVIITQVGWAGIWLGKTEIYFSHNTKNKLQNTTNHKI